MPKMLKKITCFHCNLHFSFAFVSMFMQMTLSWLAFEGQNFTGKMYVLEEGSYPDLRAMGCVGGSSSILSLQTAGFVSLYFVDSSNAIPPTSVFRAACPFKGAVLYIFFVCCVS